MPNYSKLPTITKGLIRVVVETPRGAASKLAFEPATQVFAYVRPLPVGMTYPYDWGFIPWTLGEDGDPLDGLVIHQAATAPGVVIKCNLLGAVCIKQRDPGGPALRNDRYILSPHREDAANEPVAADHVPEELRHGNRAILPVFGPWNGKDNQVQGLAGRGRSLPLDKKGHEGLRTHKLTV